MKTTRYHLAAVLCLLTLGVSNPVQAGVQQLAAGIAFVQTNKIPLDGYTIIHQAYQDNAARMALDGDILAISFPGQDGEGGVFSSGVVLIFERNQGGAGNWGLSKVIPNPNNVSMDDFGKGLALQGTTLAVGMPGYDFGETDVGAAYIYERDQGGAGNWGLVQTLVKDDIVGTDWALQLGYSLALDGDRLAVSAPYRSLQGYPGRIYFYEREAGGDGTWALAQVIVDATAWADFGFGVSIALQGDLLAVGSPRQGEVQIFQRDLLTPNTWDYRTTVTDDTDNSYYFGQQVALDGDTLSVGAPGFQHRLDDISTTYGGSAYAFERNQGGADQWGLVKRFADEARDFVDIYFGFGLAQQGDLLLVGYPLEDIAEGEINQGSVWLYDRNTGGAGQWGQAPTLLNGDGDADDYFGVALAIDGNTLAVIGQGSVYIYERQTIYSIYLPVIKR